MLQILLRETVASYRNEVVEVTHDSARPDPPTGAIPVGPDTLGEITTERFRGNQGGGGGGGHVSVDTVLRLVFWAVPIIFTAGTLFFTVKAIDHRQTQHEEHLRQLDGRASDLGTEQRVLEQQVCAIEKKQDKLIDKVDTLDEKLDEQSADLAAIREKLKVPVRGDD